MKYHRLLFPLILLIIVFACKQEPDKERIVYINNDTLSGTIIADTIIYDVLLKNTNAEDLWTDECLQYLDRSSFIDSIFASLYNEELIAYDFFTKKALSVKDITKIEEADWYSRDAIGKAQFTEIWYYNSEHNTLKKKVISIVFGVEQFNNLNEFKGHKPLFRVYLN